MSSSLREQISIFREGGDVDVQRAESLLDSLIDESDEELLAELFHAWNDKGISSNEIFAIARIMRERCTKVRAKHDTFADVVGTGGSRAKTFNVSTAAAFVVAGAGVPVAKHGNRAATSRSGSADVLSELGIEPSVDAATAERCLDEIGVCFMFAPNYHSLSPTLANVRRGLGFPTIFNCVGPLCNPAGAPHQLIGVWDETMVDKMADALARLGTIKSWIVHGNEGLDEISLAGSTSVAEIEGDTVRKFRLEPSDFGVTAEPTGELSVTSTAESAKLIRSVLSQADPGSTAETLVAMNAAAAILIAGSGADLRDSFESARESIRSGKALAKFEALSAAATL